MEQGLLEEETDHQEDREAREDQEAQEDLEGPGTRLAAACPPMQLVEVCRVSWWRF